MSWVGEVVVVMVVVVVVVVVGGRIGFIFVGFAVVVEGIAVVTLSFL